MRGQRVHQWMWLVGGIEVWEALRCIMGLGDGPTITPIHSGGSDSWSHSTHYYTNTHWWLFHQGVELQEQWLWLVEIMRGRKLPNVYDEWMRSSYLTHTQWSRWDVVPIPHIYLHVHITYTITHLYTCPSTFTSQKGRLAVDRVYMCLYTHTYTQAYTYALSLIILISSIILMEWLAMSRVYMCYTKHG